MLSFSSYFSVQYIFIFFPVVLVLYAVFPQKIRRIVLLLASFSFFWAVSGKLIIFMLLSIIEFIMPVCGYRPCKKIVPISWRPLKKGKRNRLKRIIRKNSGQPPLFAWLFI